MIAPQNHRSIDCEHGRQRFPGNAFPAAALNRPEQTKGDDPNDRALRRKERQRCDYFWLPGLSHGPRSASPCTRVCASAAGQGRQIGIPLCITTRMQGAFSGDCAFSDDAEYSASFTGNGQGPFWLVPAA